MNAIVVRAEALLQGEPLRFIVYGAAIVVWLVVGIAHAVGLSTFPVTLSLDDAMLDATAAAALLTEIGRHYVTPVASLPPSP